MLQAEQTVKDTCNEISNKYLNLMEQAKTRTQGEFLLSIVQRDQLILLVRMFGLEGVEKELRELPEVEDYLL